MPLHPPLYSRWATVMAQVSEGYWEMGRVLSHQVVKCPDGRMGYRYEVAFISSRVYTFYEDELGRPEEVVDRRLAGQDSR
ncbi:hypothetical protein FRB99_006222 [Tulasnella sp. 403]|nr:hypothetical protein FRB99_006222 [Tulasnella sp. 403]